MNTFVRAIYVFDDHLKIVINHGLGEDIEIPLSDMQADYPEEDFDMADVRISDTKPHQVNTVRTTLIFRNYGIIVVVPY